MSLLSIMANQYYNARSRPFADVGRQQITLIYDYYAFCKFLL